jgi:hypothetical protein
MKIKVIIETIVDTDEYSDVKNQSQAKKLIKEAIDGLADWPDNTKVVAALKQIRITATRGVPSLRRWPAV